MKPYKLKHVPTGLYYQPHKHMGSNLSKLGKVYQTGTHGLSSALKYAEKYKDTELMQMFSVYTERDSQIHKLTKDVFDWNNCSYSAGQMKSYTKLSDWVVEYL